MDYAKILSLLGFSILTGLMTLDIYQDFKEGSKLSHLLIELILLSGGLIGFTGILWQLLKNKLSYQQLKVNYEKLSQEKDRWKSETQSYLNGLTQSIEKQLVKWQLSPAEQEIAFMILKGFSFKEIAHLRGVSERTVRQQTLKVYEKSNTAGRAEFAAFFLEDFLVPSNYKLHT